MTHPSYATQARVASGINIALGAWLLASSWVFRSAYGDPGIGPLLNNAIVGALVMILAASRFLSPENNGVPSWVNLVLGLWAVVSPWTMGFSGHSVATLNNIMSGAAIVALAAWSAGATIAEHRHDHSALTAR